MERGAERGGANGRGDVLPPGTAPAAGETEARFLERVAMWEDLLTLVVDPDSARVEGRERKRRALSFLLERAGLDEPAFWQLARGQRGRLFLSRWSRVSRDVPRLELTSFDLDKLLKERFRQEPLTLGAAWHYGFWRSYFSHAAITHPANDGLREEFSTAWDIVRKHPAVLFRTADGDRQQPLRGEHLDMPMIVGSLPYTDGVTMERAYLEAIAAADPAKDLHTRTLVVLTATQWLAHSDAFAPHAGNVWLRLEAGDGSRLDALRDPLARAAVIEIPWSSEAAPTAAGVRKARPEALLAIGLRYEDGDAFWRALEQSVAIEGVAAIHYHAGAEKSYRLTPKIDAYLKARFVRARVQLVSAGGDTDTQASAATVYESVLPGANGGSMSDVAGIALFPN